MGNAGDDSFNVPDFSYIPNPSFFELRLPSNSLLVLLLLGALALGALFRRGGRGRHLLLGGIPLGLALLVGGGGLLLALVLLLGRLLGGLLDLGLGLGLVGLAAVLLGGGLPLGLGGERVGVEAAPAHGVALGLVDVLLVLVLVEAAKVVARAGRRVVLVVGDGRLVDDLAGVAGGGAVGLLGLRGRGADLLELGDEEAVDVVGVRVVAAGEFQRGVELLAHERGEALATEGEVGVNELDVGAAGEGVLDNGLAVLLVDDETARFAVVVDRVDGGQDQLLLHVRQQHEIPLRLVGLDAGVLGNDTGTRAGRIEKHTVETAHGLGELASVVVGDDDVAGAEAVDVTNETLGTLLAGIVGDNDTRVLHHGGHVRGLSTGGGGHIQHALVLLRLEGHDGQERGRGLEDVVAGEVLGRRTEGHVALEDLQTDLGPLADGLEGDTTRDEGLGEVAAMGAEGVCPDDDGAGRLVGLEEGERLARGEQVEELLGEVLGVAVVGADVLDELGDVLDAGASVLVEELQIGREQRLGLGCELVVLVVKDVRLVAVDVGLDTHLLELSLRLGVLRGDLLVEPPRETLDVGLCELLLAVRLVFVLREHVLAAAALLLVRVEDGVVVRVQEVVAQTRRCLLQVGELVNLVVAHVRAGGLEVAKVVVVRHVFVLVLDGLSLLSSAVRLGRSGLGRGRLALLRILLLRGGAVGLRGSLLVCSPPLHLDRLDGIDWQTGLALQLCEMGLRQGFGRTLLLHTVSDTHFDRSIACRNFGYTGVWEEKWGIVKEYKKVRDVRYRLVWSVAATLPKKKKVHLD
ncbi:hypothetical protein ColTof3_04349 [Colletotrichum tofieldiae]|nr:hypothetical protein ColTof3_04349 [Colletotrichum tofieldiae]